MPKPLVWALVASLLLEASCLTWAQTRLFFEPLTGETVPQAVDVWEGAFAAGPEGLRPATDGLALAVPAGMPDVAECVISVLARPVERRQVGGWATAGLTVWQDAGNNWVLFIVEGPTGERYCELLERYQGVHQAQSQPPTRLEAPVSEAGPPWEYGREYALRLTLMRHAIEGTVTDVASGQVIFRRKFLMPPGVPATRTGTPGIQATGLDVGFRDLEVQGDERDAPGRLVSALAENTLVMLDQPDAPPAFRDALERALRAQGTRVTRLSLGDVRDRHALLATNAATLIVPWSPSYPLNGCDALLTFLRHRGRLLAIGGTLCTEAVRAAEEDLKRREAALAATPPAGQFLDLTKMQASDFARGASPEERGGRCEIVPGEGPGAPDWALHITFDDFRSWENYTAACPPLPQDNLVTLVRAKGDGRAEYLVVEWVESDGSRWMHTVPLTTEWQTYALLPHRFFYWPDNPSKGRGYSGDRPHLDKVRAFAVALAQMRGPISPGRHEVWVGGFGYAPVPAGLEPLTWTPPVLETLSPDYKTYRLEHVGSFAPSPAQVGLMAVPVGLEGLDVVSPIPRSHASEFRPSQGCRWLPLLEGQTDSGGEATLAAIYMVNRGRFRGARWGTLGVARVEDLERRADPLAQVAAQVTRRLTQPLRLAHGGLNQACCIVTPDGDLEGFAERPAAGAEIVNDGASPEEVELRIWLTVEAAEENGVREILRETVVAEPLANTTRSVSADVLSQRLNAVGPGQHQVTTELWHGGMCVDRLERKVSFIAPPSAQKEDMIQVQDGQFVLGGQPWHPHGINFWPRYASGTEPTEYGLHWLAPEQYNPQEVEEDLRIAASLGLNCLSIIYGAADQAAPLNDFLARCQRHGIHAYVYVGGLHPVSGDIKTAVRLISAARLMQNPAVFAYDIAWEPHWGGYGERRAHRAAWERWVLGQYGSVAAAERDWGFPIPRSEDGQVDVPSDQQIRTDGAWTRMACAYSRFLDDYIGSLWLRQTRALRAADPYHLLSYRAAAQPGWSGWGAYDMVAAGPFVDFLGPEGYGLRPSEAGFTTAYARWAGNGKPVWWAEFGHNIGRHPKPEDIETQRELWEGFVQMALDSEANGTAGWWFPGGWRVGEQSDFGVIAPEGIPRPAALELRRLAHTVHNPPPPRAERVKVTIDRDLHAANYQAVYEDNKHAWVEANRAGRGLDVVTEATGTTSATVPVLAIGNVPCTGDNPPKYLNALFDRVEIRVGDGEWQSVEDAATLTIPAQRPLWVRARVVNVSEPTWLAGGDVGRVVLAAGQRGGLACEVPLPRDVKRHEWVEIGPAQLSPGLTADATVTFAMRCLGRAWFGERVSVALKLGP